MTTPTSLLSLREAARGLAANAGALRAFEPEVRAAIGNSNWSAIMSYVARVDAALSQEADLASEPIRPMPGTMGWDWLMWFASEMHRSPTASLAELLSRLGYVAAPQTPSPVAPEPVAFFYRFHTDDSLAGKPNVRSWQLCEGKPSPGLYNEGEVRLLVDATPQPPLAGVQEDQA